MSLVTGGSATAIAFSSAGCFTFAGGACPSQRRHSHPDGAGHGAISATLGDMGLSGDAVLAAVLTH